jgi:multidrug efflux pump subunit AcrB
MSRAADEVQVAIDSVTDLPEDAEAPTVRRGAWWDRVTDVVITGPVAPEQLGRFADEFVARLFDAGVTRATIRGVAAPEVVVEVPSASLIRYDISMAEIAAVIAAAADTAPAGEIDAAGARVRTGAATAAPRGSRRSTLRTNDDGSALTIGDVARIEVGGTDRERAYFVGRTRPSRSAWTGPRTAMPSPSSARSRRRGRELESRLPEGTSIDLIRTRAEAISGRLNILLDNALLGLALVVGLLFLFLNARTAFWVAAGIPVALIAAIALMYAAGLTLNMISLFALIITLGIVVDDAIVVGEHADFRYRTLGEDPVTAAENAASAWPRRCFRPPSRRFSPSRARLRRREVRGLIADIPFTVIVVLLASLVECFLILPNHMAHALAIRRRSIGTTCPRGS